MVVVRPKDWVCCCCVTSVVSDAVRSCGRQPTRPRRPWDSPGKNTGVGCHFLLQRMKVKSESEVAQSCLTPSNPMDCSLPGSCIHGIFQARVLEWGAIAFSVDNPKYPYNSYILLIPWFLLFLATWACSYLLLLLDTWSISPWKPLFQLSITNHLKVQWQKATIILSCSWILLG